MLLAVRYVMFELNTTSSNARAGQLTLRNIQIHTPAFMPVGTLATVKGMTATQLKDLNYRLILANTYHLLQRPGLAVIKAFAGLRNFMAWDGAILTDSGGYQVFSLNDTCRTDEHGVRFRSIYDGAEIRMTPESVVDSQLIFDSDIMMPLDICLPADDSYARLEQAMHTTHAWAEVSWRHWQESTRVEHNHLYGIIQGGCSKELRQRSADKIASIGFSGLAIGGLAVGESPEQRQQVLEDLLPRLPRDKPRYLMGVGTPEDLIDAISCGVDQFDCVIPTRHARNGHLFTDQGIVRIRNSGHRQDPAPLSSNCTCFCCQTHSRAYLHHLYRNKEILASVLGTIHNLHYYNLVVSRARQAIVEDRFADFYHEFKARTARTSTQGSADEHGSKPMNV